MAVETEAYPDPRPLILKRMMWDVFPHDYDIIRDAQHDLGLVPDDDEGMEVEHDASDTRIARMSPLNDTIGTLGEIAGTVVAYYIVNHLQADVIPVEAMVPQEVIEQFEAQTAEVVRHGSYAVISHLMNTGVLAYSEKFRNMMGCA